MSQQIITSDKSILKRFGLRPTMAEQGFKENENIRVCPHCGKAKQHKFGRYWTPCPICSNAAPYRKKIKIK